MTIADLSVDADVGADEMLLRSDLEPVITSLRSLLARVSSGEVIASAAFEQRLFGGLIAMEIVASGARFNARTLIAHWADS